MTTDPQTIPDRFVKNGWHYKLVERTPKGAIYSQSRVPDLPEGGKAAAYEVMRVRTREARTRSIGHGKTMTFRGGEYLPATEEWGRHGWTCLSLDAARAHLSRISATPNTQERAL